MTTPRGIRNHNPLNIRRTDTTWKGQAAGGDKAFVTFVAPEDGIRAAARILQTYQEQHGITTLTGIVNRWAPPTENDTNSYLTAVSIWSGLDKDAQLDLADYDTALAVLRAMARMENGKPPEGMNDWYESAVWERGLRMAGLTPTKKLVNSRTMTGTATAAAGTTAAIAIITDSLQLPPGLADLLPVALSGLSDQTVALIALGVAVVGNLLAGYARHDDKLNGRL